MSPSLSQIDPVGQHDPSKQRAVHLMYRWDDKLHLISTCPLIYIRCTIRNALSRKKTGQVLVWSILEDVFLVTGDGRRDLQHN
jgi:hypothetical protein